MEKEKLCDLCIQFFSFRYESMNAKRSKYASKQKVFELELIFPD